MMYLRHNIVSILYTIKELLGAYLVQVEEGRFVDRQERLNRAEEVMKRSIFQADKAIQRAKRLGYVLKESVTLKRGCSKVSVKTAWKQVMDHLRKGFPENHIQIIERVPDDFPLIHCDRNDFKETLYYLAKNSLDAMAAGDKLIIRTEIGCNTVGHPVATITLADTGSGISEDHLSRLFKPFYTTKPDGEGNGLGLYLARELVLRNSGTIAASSFKGEGTTFTLQFPIYSGQDVRNTIAA